MSKRRTYIGLLIWLGVCLGTAWFGSRFTPGAWYAGLIKPVWTPPEWVFGPVWLGLYIMMAVAAWRVWLKRGFSEAGFELLLFLLQLLVNALWSWLFFGLQRPGWAGIDLGILWVLLVLTTVGFWRVSREAGLLLVPYLAWVSFAGVLNLAIWRLNRL